MPLLRFFSCLCSINSHIFLLGIILCFNASSAPISLETTVQGENRQAITDSRDINDKAYLSLTSITNQFGGAYSILPNRIRVDLMGSTAWLGINDNRVNALSIFSLENPVIRFEEDIWMAQEDINEFFTKSFRLDIIITETISNEILDVNDPEILDIDTPDVQLTTPIEKLQSIRTIQSIIVDPGHGGYDPGLKGAAGVVEKDVTLQIASRLHEILRQKITIPVSITRNQDIDLTDHQRLTAGIESQADLMVSIHVAGSFSPNLNGIALFYPKKTYTSPGALITSEDNSDTSEYYAKVIAHSLGLKTNSILRGIHPSSNTLFRYAPMACVLVEIGHITNPVEESMLKTDDYQNKVAQGIAAGIMEVVKQQQSLNLSPIYNPSELNSIPKQ